MFVINQHNFESAPATGLIHHWPLHASPNDLVGGRNWSVNGSEVYGTNRDGIANKAAVFTGSTTYFQLASDLNIGTTYTISLWFYGKVQAPMILNKWPTSAFPYLFALGDSTEERLSSEDIIWTIGNNKNIDDTWYHFVLTRSANTHNLYRNNSLRAGSPKTSTTNSDFVIRTLNKRYNNTDNLYALNGKLSDVRIYNRVLSTDEITALYNE